VAAQLTCTESVYLFGEDGGDESDQGLAAGEDPDDRRCGD
jgi:hypothetical protein